MSAARTVAEPVAVAEPEYKTRIVFTQGGKGGVGKTAFTSLLVEWYARHGLKYALLDLDTENKSRGSLSHFFHQAEKVNIHTSAGLDAFVDVIEEGTPLVIADMGSGSGAVTYRWFDEMYGSVKEAGVRFTAIGIVTPDPASVESVCAWAHALQDRADYLVVKNAITDPADFSYWTDSLEGKVFREVFSPAEISMEYRLPKVENPARQHGVTMYAIADRKHCIPELSQATVVMRAQAYRRNLFAELDRVKEVLL